MKRLLASALEYYVQLKWKLFGFYYERLLVQAEHIYHQSSLFRERWQQLGLDFAEEAFRSNSHYFFKKAKGEPFLIRCQLFFDGLFGKPRRPYYLPRTP